MERMMQILTSRKHKKSKIAYYFKVGLRHCIPSCFHRMQLKYFFKSYAQYQPKELAYRVNYYNKLNAGCTNSAALTPAHRIKLPKSERVYYFDTFEHLLRFPKQLKLDILKGDITYVPNHPAVVKSRPIVSDNQNSVILKLDKARHFMFVNDTTSFGDKKNKLIGRGVVSIPHRTRFYEMYHAHPLCDLGAINLNCKNPAWIVPKIPVDAHLGYKFILCLEGNDVATNLKWVMSSNSLAVMPKPKFETWFMEGTLIPDFHFIEIKEDYSDLEERLTYFINHPEEAVQISRNAQAYVKQFRNPRKEDLISALVLMKYFHQTGQPIPQWMNHYVLLWDE